MQCCSFQVWKAGGYTIYLPSCLDQHPFTVQLSREEPGLAAKQAELRKMLKAKAKKEPTVVAMALNTYMVFIGATNVGHWRS